MPELGTAVGAPGIEAGAPQVAVRGAATRVRRFARQTQAYGLEAIREALALANGAVDLLEETANATAWSAINMQSQFAARRLAIGSMSKSGAEAVQEEEEEDAIFGIGSGSDLDGLSDLGTPLLAEATARRRSRQRGVCCCPPGGGCTCGPAWLLPSARANYVFLSVPSEHVNTTAVAALQPSRARRGRAASRAESEAEEDALFEIGSGSELDGLSDLGTPLLGDASPGALHARTRGSGDELLDEVEALVKRGRVARSPLEPGRGARACGGCGTIGEGRAECGEFRGAEPAVPGGGALLDAAMEADACREKLAEGRNAISVQVLLAAASVLRTGFDAPSVMSDSPDASPLGASADDLIGPAGAAFHRVNAAG